MQLNKITYSPLESEACILILACSGYFQQIDPSIFHDLSADMPLSVQLFLNHGCIRVSQLGKQRYEKNGLFPGDYTLQGDRSISEIAGNIARALAGYIEQDAAEGIARGLRLYGKVKAIIVEG